MFIQRGCAPLHLVLDDSGLSVDEKLLLLPRLLAAGADVNQTVTDGSLVCMCMIWKAVTWFIITFAIF